MPLQENYIDIGSYLFTIRNAFITREYDEENNKEKIISRVLLHSFSAAIELRNYSKRRP
jgi:hypothetical protein